MKFFARLLLTACLATTSFTYGYCMDDEEDDVLSALGMMGGTPQPKQESLLDILHSVVPTNGDRSTRDQHQIVFGQPVTLTAPIATDNSLILFTLIYNPDQAASPCSRALADVEEDGGLFKVFLKDFRNHLLEDSPHYQAKTIETQLLLLQTKKTLLLEKLKYNKFNNNPQLFLDTYNGLGGKELDDQLLAITMLPTELDTCLSGKVIQGFKPFARSYAVPTNPQKFYIEGQKAQKKRGLTGPGDKFLALSIHLQPYENPKMEQSLMVPEPSQTPDSGAKPALETCSLRFNSNQTLDYLFRLGEQTIMHQLNSILTAVQEYNAKPDSSSSMHG